jgi:hypothetical protein
MARRFQTSLLLLLRAAVFAAISADVLAQGSAAPRLGATPSPSELKTGTRSSAWPFTDRAAATPAPGAAAGRPTPSAAPLGDGSREVRLVEKKWEELPNQQVSAEGKVALQIDPTKWRHAETENFLIHYRRLTEAQKVAREVEFDLAFVATTLGATKERYTRKSHVYVFEDEEEWSTFIGKTGMPSWAASFAYGDELFLNVRRANDTGRFDSQTLAHEATHAVVARLFPRTRWPLWLSEGFAEYMGSASVAARKGQSVKRHQTRLQMAEMPLATMEQMLVYPSDPVEVAQLYQTSEKFVRFLMSELPPDRITKFIDAVLQGRGMQAAVLEVYGDKLKDWAAFEKRYERFLR